MFEKSIYIHVVGFKVTVVAPTLGLPIGKAMKKVRKAIQEGEPFDC